MQTFYSRHVAEAKFVLFLDHNFTSTSVGSESITIVNVLLASFYFCVSFFSEIYFMFIVLVLGVSSISIWQGTSNFMDTLPREQFWTGGCHQMQLELKALERITQNYVSLVDLADEINNVWCKLGVYALTDICIWLSTDLNKIWRSANHLVSIYSTCMIGYLIVGMILSAESSRKVSNAIICAPLSKVST